MTDLIGQFAQLNDEQKRCVHLILCENALQIWTNYVTQFDEISYIESVVGTHQIVDKLLPKDAFESVKNGKDLSKIDNRYAEPISAMQDDDLEFPDEIKFAYYAIYNLFNRYILQQNIDDWLICNQALAAEFNSERQKFLLNDAILQSLK
jgi:hypothetical protein